MLTGTENDELAEKSYTPYLINKALSYYPDTILYANEMNLHHHIDNKLQYYYLINSIRARKRFSKWAKKQDSDDLEVVKEYYGYSNEKAQQALSVLTNTQIQSMREKLQKGG